jgi:hypothetical protein
MRAKTGFPPAKKFRCVYQIATGRSQCLRNRRDLCSFLLGQPSSMNLRNPKIQFMDSRVVEGATYAELDTSRLGVAIDAPLIGNLFIESRA